MIKLLKSSLLDFRDTYKKYLFFELLFMLVTSFVFVPILATAFNRILRFMGASPLLNDQVYQLNINYKGFIGMFVTCILLIFVVFLEYGVMIIIAEKKYFNKSVYISDALITTIHKTPKIIGFGILQFIVLFFLLIPFFDSPMLAPLIGNINIHILITNNLKLPTIFLVIYGIAFLGIFYLILRWIFTLHFIIIEGKSTNQAIKCSILLTKHHQVRIVLSLLFFNIILIAVGILLITSISYVPRLFHMKNDLIKNYLITLSSYLTYVLSSLILIPINIILITRLFFRFHMEQGKEIKDHLRIFKFKWLNKIENATFDFFGKRKYLLLFILSLYITGTFMLNYSVTEGILKWDVIITGHRGDKIHAPENSLSGIQYALEEGVDAVEIDIQVTKDGIFVLNHDTNLKRVADVSKKVSDLTYEELLKLTIGSHYPRVYAEERIPTLEQVLQMVKGKAKVMIDIKTDTLTTPLTEALIGLIQENEMVGDCYIQSFNYEILKKIRSIDGAIKIGQIMYAASGDLSELDVDFYTIEQIMVSKKFIEQAHKQKREVWVWTVNISRNIAEVLQYDVDGIITDFPGKVRDIIGRD